MYLYSCYKYTLIVLCEKFLRELKRVAIISCSDQMQRISKNGTFTDIPMIYTCFCMAGFQCCLNFARKARSTWICTMIIYVDFCPRKVNGSYICAGCGWPLCGDKCRDTKAHQRECMFFQVNSQVSSSNVRSSCSSR